VTLTSTVAQNTSLYLEGLGGATITWCLGSTYTRSADGSVELGDLYQPVAVPRGRLRAFNVGQLAMETREATVVVTRPPLTPINQPQTNAKRMPNECQTNAKRMLSIHSEQKALKWHSFEVPRRCRSILESWPCPAAGEAIRLRRGG
jgi:hypothetical protein